MRKVKGSFKQRSIQAGNFQKKSESVMTGREMQQQRKAEKQQRREANRQARQMSAKVAPVANQTYTSKADYSPTYSGMGQSLKNEESLNKLTEWQQKQKQTNDAVVPMKKKKVWNANWVQRHTIPQKIARLGITDLTKLRKSVKSSNLQFIDFKFDKDFGSFNDDNIENEKGTLTVGFKNGGVYEYSDCEFYQYCELLTGGKAGFYHHKGEKHSFTTLSRGHYFYYFIRDKYPTKKIR